KDTTLSYEVTTIQTTTLSPPPYTLSSGTVEISQDKTFNITIDPTTWDGYSGTVKVIVNFQDSTNTDSFIYLDTPNMESETLYNMIMETNSYLESMESESITINQNILTEINLFQTTTIEDGNIFYLTWNPIISQDNIDVTIIPATGTPFDINAISLNSKNSIITPAQTTNSNPFDVQLQFPELSYTSDSVTLHQQGDFVTISPLHNSYDLQDTIILSGNTDIQNSIIDIYLPDGTLQYRNTINDIGEFNIEIPIIHLEELTSNSSYLVEFSNPINDDTILTAFTYSGDTTSVNPNIWVHAEIQKIWDYILAE
ncbi:MAG: hypothetical protein V3W20_03305, partial [Candidatus Neomarinimicrobiota bacterium]